MGSGLRKKKGGMGDYLPTEEERKAMVWCIDNRVCKISPLASTPGQASEWHLEIWTGNKWNKSRRPTGLRRYGKNYMNFIYIIMKNITKTSKFWDWYTGVNCVLLIINIANDASITTQAIFVLNMVIGAIGRLKYYDK